MLIGYIRVSSASQVDNGSLAAQRLILEQEGIESNNIFSEVSSGLVFDSTSRPVLHRAFDEMSPGDTLVVCRLDRFGRSIIGCLLSINALYQRGCLFRHLDAPPISWDEPADVLRTAIFSYLGEAEAKLRKERTALGIKRAKEEGKYRGRRSKITDNLLKQLAKHRSKDLTCKESCALLGIGRSLYYRALRHLPDSS